MIQILFAGIFVTITLPVLYSLAKNRYRAEAILERAGRPGMIVIAILLAIIAAAQLTVTGGPDLFALAGVSSSTAALLNNAVFDTLIRTPTHELGHFLFQPLGETMWFLGGSLLEFLLPASLFTWFLLCGCPRLASIFLFLVSQSMFYISRYMSTARARETLLYLSTEQDPEMHDWYRVFKNWGVLEQNESIAAIMFYGAVAMLMLSLAAMVFLPGAGGVEES